MAKILEYKKACSEKYYDISEFLANRINNTKGNYKDFTSYTDILLTKNETHTHITRALTHIMLDITVEDVDSFKEYGTIFYAKPLSVDITKTKLLKCIKSNSSIELIERFGDFYKKQSGITKKMLDLNLKADALYNHIALTKTGQILPNDFVVKNSDLYI